uniref:Putative transcriptional regulator n=1 Tax=Chlorobium chlorochromatii (strain CaD3) TaxID=340177 RepID=Q3ASU5_CHLCH
MFCDDLKGLIASGEDSFTQFKENIFDSKKLAEEFVAFSNAEGGVILLGVNDKRELVGLDNADIHRLNQLISNTANENVKPPIYPLVEHEIIDGKQLLIVRVRKGYAKPYATSSGVYLTKSGSDKRKMSREELRRLFAESGGLSADETVIHGSDIRDINTEILNDFLIKRDREIFEALRAQRVQLVTICENLDLVAHGQLTLAGNLLFGREPQRFSKSFYVQCVHFDGNDVGCNSFISKDIIYGTLQSMYKQTLNFLKSSLRRVQKGKNFNTLGEFEIPEICLTEALINALIHRDYFISSSIKVFIFEDRVEIISPGKLPNSLSVEKVRLGISIHRNPILNSLGQYLLPYSGLGSGIRRIEAHYPSVKFINDTDKEEFWCVFSRSI